MVNAFGYRVLWEIGILMTPGCIGDWCIYNVLVIGLCGNASVYNAFESQTL